LVLKFLGPVLERAKSAIPRPEAANGSDYALTADFFARSSRQW
jgi:hypothetical protein